MTAVVCLTQSQFSQLMLHLIPRRHNVEQLAFLFVKPEQSRDSLRLVCEDTWCCAPDELDHQSAYHISLRDETKASLIKKAHDTECALVELHSHVGNAAAEFSPSDHFGFEEFVPHVRWRLKGQPYAAIVVTKRDMDGFIWAGQEITAARLQGIEVDGSLAAKMNGLSSLQWSPLPYEKF